MNEAEVGRENAIDESNIATHNGVFDLASECQDFVGGIRRRPDPCSTREHPYKKKQIAFEHLRRILSLVFPADELHWLSAAPQVHLLAAAELLRIGTRSVDGHVYNHVDIVYPPERLDDMQLLRRPNRSVSEQGLSLRTIRRFVAASLDVFYLTLHADRGSKDVVAGLSFQRARTLCRAPSVRIAGDPARARRCLLEGTFSLHTGTGNALREP